MINDTDDGRIEEYKEDERRISAVERRVTITRCIGILYRMFGMKCKIENGGIYFEVNIWS